MGSPSSMPGESPFEQLMIRYQQNDPEAASELVRLLSPRMLTLLRRPRLTRAYAEDLLQESWLRIHQARHSFRPGSPVLPWILTIAQRTRCDGYRRLQHTGVFREIPLDAAADQVPHLCSTDLSLYCSELISSLPKGQRDAIVLMKVRGLTLDEVAGLIRSTPGAVKQKAHRGYRRLRLMHRSDSGARRAA
jgi:RNA polymerase sigma-70 factor (ECF subfamily)